MAVSQNTQNGFYARHADETHYVTTLPEAEALKETMRATGEYARVTHFRWNNGSRAQPRWEYMVKAWTAK